MKYVVMVLLGVGIVAFFGWSVSSLVKDIKEGKFRFLKKKKEEEKPSDQLNKDLF